jgi:uncharacterized protein
MRFRFALALVAAATLAAQEAPNKTPLPSIETTGEATVSAKPDRATLEIGVVTEGATAEAAGTENANQLSAVLKQLRSLGSGADIKTINYSLTPNYRYPKPGGAPVISNYTARNTVEFTTGDLSLVAKAIDTATQSGANHIQRVNFGLKDEGPVRAQALRQAARQARASADAIASALGLKITRVLSAVESTPSVHPPRPMVMAMEARAAPTPVESGTIDIKAVVTLTVQVE